MVYSSLGLKYSFDFILWSISLVSTCVGLVSKIKHFLLNFLLFEDISAASISILFNFFEQFCNSFSLLSNLDNNVVK